jgi:hypothetical protein
VAAGADQVGTATSSSTSIAARDNLLLPQPRVSSGHALELRAGLLSCCLGVPILLAGVAFSTWPDGWAEVWPSWLSPLALGFLGACAGASWLCWAILARLRADSVTAI